MKRLYFILVASLLIVGCSKSDTEVDITNSKLYSPIFYAEFDRENSRTYVDENIYQRWHQQDLISVFTSTTNQKYQFNGETGDNSGSFSVIGNQYADSNIPLSVDANFAVYPYDERTTISNDGTILLFFPNEQSYAQNSFGIGANPMFAKTDDKTDTELQFRNLCGFLRLQLYGEDIIIKRVQIFGMNNEQLGGAAQIKYYNEGEPVLTMCSEPAFGSIINLNCEEGVKIGSTREEATDFWLVIPPTVFENGFVISIEDTDGAYMHKVYEKEFSIERNIVKTMSPLLVQTNGISILEDTYTIGTDGGYIDIDVRLTGDLYVNIPDSAKSWVKYIEPTRAMRNETIRLEISPLETGGYRSCEVSIYSMNDYGGIGRGITINQGDIINIDLNNLEYEFGMNGGDLDIEIQTNVDILVTISENAQDWIKQIETRVLDTKILHFNIAASTTGEVREGTITFSSGNASKTVTVKQVKAIPIPDAAFKAYCIKNFDINNDGDITISEACNVTKIEVYSDNIETLQGIEYFENLEQLIIYPEHDISWGMGVGGGPDSGEWRDSGHYLNGIRVSGKIESLDVSKNTALQYLDCSGNMITSLDLTNNPMLYGVNASFNLDLKEIRFASENNRIKTLSLGSTSIQTIDLSNLVELEELRIDRGLGLTSLDVSNNSKLISLDITRNWLDNIDISNNYRLESFDCAISPISKLDVSNNLNLISLGFGFSNVKEIDLSNNIRLKGLTFQNANLSNVDITMLSELENIHFGNYQKETDVDGTVLNVINTIENIDLSHNTKLQHLFATMLDLEEIDISHNVDLKRVFVEYNLLAKLDVSNSLYLEELSAYYNPNLSTIYVSPEQKFSYSIDAHTNFAYKGEDASMYKSTDYSKDGEVKLLQSATKGDGIDIVLMGDAYSDRLIADGTYDKVMNTAMEKFFMEEPYKSYRDYFNVYSVTAVSENDVYNLVSSTAFAGYFGGGTLVGGNDERVFSYAQKAIGAERMDDALIVVMMNSDAYAGTCYMYYPSDGDWSNGVSISYFPVGQDDTALAQVLHHEAAGHGFSKLGDEYAYEEMGNVPEWEIESAQTMATYGWWKNVDFTNDPAKIKWSHFLSDSRYAGDGLGVYEGAFTYWTGAYRPTYNSIMRYNTGGFNAPSREAIYYRIHKLAYGADWEYDYEKFVEWDARNRKTASATRGVPYRLDIPEDFKPLHAPVVMKTSWRNAKNNAPAKKYVTPSNNTGNAGRNLQKASLPTTAPASKSMTATKTIALPDGTTRTITTSASGATQTTYRNNTKK